MFHYLFFCSYVDEWMWILMWRWVACCTKMPNISGKHNAGPTYVYQYSFISQYMEHTNATRQIKLPQLNSLLCNKSLSGSVKVKKELWEKRLEDEYVAQIHIEILNNAVKGNIVLNLDNFTLFQCMFVWNVVLLPAFVL